MQTTIGSRIALVLMLGAMFGCGAAVSPGLGGTDGGSGTDAATSVEAGADTGVRPDSGDCVFPGGRVCPAGTTCRADDGCNTCTCGPGGSLGCTLLACVTDGGISLDAGPRTCTSNAGCLPSEQCTGAPGCGTPWTCQPILGRPCSTLRVTLCGCDGVTFQASVDCPGRQYAFVGSCSAPPPGCPLPGGGMCPVGGTCPAGDGCNTCSCGTDGSLRCTTLGCPPPDGGTRTTCLHNTDCGPTEMCDGPAGCGTPWRCVPAPPCTADLTAYCACDGSTTFEGSSSCPGQPYVHRGPCEGVDGGPFDGGSTDGGSTDGGSTDGGSTDGGTSSGACLLGSGWYCAVGSTCPAGDGCNDCTCEASGTLRCTARPCAFDGGPAHPTCASSHDCSSLEECAGPPGCGTPWTCRPRTGRFCSPALTPYCLCSGETVLGSPTCPPGPYSFMGECGAHL